MDDEDDPHLGRGSTFTNRSTGDIHDEDDPYLRLDEEEIVLDHAKRFDSDHRPFIAAEEGKSGRQGGWLSHQSTKVSPSPPSDTSSDSGNHPADISLAGLSVGRPTPNVHHQAPLTESLLPRNGVARSVDAFNLPDPRSFPRKRMTRKDSHWTAAWLGSVTACFVGSFIILFTTSVPKSVPNNAVLPYTTLLHTIPLLTVLTLVSSIVSYFHILLLGLFVKPVLLATSAFIPVTLFISAIWAFVGSFMWEAGSEPTWSETVG